MVTKGNILAIDGKRSSSVDCVLLSPAHPDLKDENNRHSLLLAEGVDAAIEVKPDLANQTELKRALKQGWKVKGIHREKINSFLASKIARQKSKSIGQSETKFLHTIPYFVVTNKTPEDVKAFLSKIVEYYEENSTKRIHQFDMIIDLNGLVIWNHSWNSYIDLSREVERALTFFNLGDLSLVMLLLWLERIPKSEMTISNGVLHSYIKLQLENLQSFPDLNDRLSKIDAC